MPQGIEGGEFRVIISRAQAMDELVVKAEYGPEVRDLGANSNSDGREKIRKNFLNSCLGRCALIVFAGTHLWK